MNGRGALNLVHTHPMCLLSGAYCVRAEPGCGKLFFLVPRPVAAFLVLPPRHRVHPVDVSESDLRAGARSADPVPGLAPTRRRAEPVRRRPGGRQLQRRPDVGERWLNAARTGAKPPSTATPISASEVVQALGRMGEKRPVPLRPVITAVGRDGTSKGVWEKFKRNTPHDVTRVALASEPTRGLEPRTYALRKHCSTN